MRISTDTLHPFPPGLLENTEAAYWQGIYRYRSEGPPRAWISIGGGIATAFPGLDILAFNRVLGLGVYTRPTIRPHQLPLYLLSQLSVMGRGHFLYLRGTNLWPLLPTRYVPPSLPNSTCLRRTSVSLCAVVCRCSTVSPTTS